MSEHQRSQRVLVPAASLLAGVIIGFVEALLAVSFAAFVFGGRIQSHLSCGIRLV